MFPGLSKARLAVQSKGGRSVRWSPQTESAQPVLPRPAEDFLEQGTSDSAPSPCGFYPHTADPPHLGPVLVKEAIGRAQHIVALIGEEHHMTSGFGNRMGEVLPVTGGPRHNVREGFAKGIWRLLQGSQAKLTVEAYLVWLQPSKVHEITHRAVERPVSAAAEGRRLYTEVMGLIASPPSRAGTWPRYPFSSFRSSLRMRQSVPSAISFLGLDLMCPVSWRRRP
jgi:hypothetical protein